MSSYTTTRKNAIIVMTTEQITEAIEINQVWQDMTAIAGDEPTTQELEEMQLLRDELSLREFAVWIETQA